MPELDNDTYSLPRGGEEIGRLELQHHHLVKILGFILHPRIKAAGLPSDAHIGDIATGTGIWLRDLSVDSSTSWKLTGLDISDAQFQNNLEDGRVQFDLLNVLEPIPDKWKNAFDVVHIRLLVLALRSEDYEKVAANVLQLLKPGGWIQWQEHSGLPGRVVQSALGASRAYQDKIRGLMEAYASGLGKQLSRDAIRRPSVLAKAGFQDVYEDVFDIDRDVSIRETYLLQSTKVVIWALQLARKEDPSIATEAELEEWGAKALEEAKGGKLYLSYPTHVVTAQKPF